CTDGAKDSPDQGRTAVPPQREWAFNSDCCYANSANTGNLKASFIQYCVPTNTGTLFAAPGCYSTSLQKHIRTIGDGGPSNHAQEHLTTKVTWLSKSLPNPNPKQLLCSTPRQTAYQRRP
ncbi:hypothetical protein LY76DRAFT_635559, partial [Colletotrichum caudatum]